jgi:NADPH2:quinone reductase
VRAIRLEGFGGPDVLKLQELPDPEPGEGELLVQIKAIGLNFIETYQRSGAYPISLPRTLGTEASGVVLALGAGVSGFAPGDRVVFTGSAGSYADITVAPAAGTVKLDDDMPFDTGVALYLQGLTAHALCTSVYPLKPGEWSLVHAGAGGVGLLLTQMIKMRGGHEEKAVHACAAGADEVILYSKDDFVMEVARITHGAKLPVVYDSVGKDTFAGSLECLRSRGYMVLYGQSSGRVDPVDPQLLNAKGSLFLTRPTMMDYTETREELLARANDIYAWAAEGKLNASVGLTLPLEQAADAHRALEGRKTTGKVILIP